MARPTKYKDDEERRRASVKRRKDLRRNRVRGPKAEESITPEMIADRDRREKAKLTNSQYYFGDPRPGQSALDKIRAEQSFK